MEGEPDQVFRRMLVLDGNNSLKRMSASRAQRDIGDDRVLTQSDYFLDSLFVDSFQDEIRRPVQTHVKEEPKDEIDSGDKAYITETDDPRLEDCASNWKAAASMDKKKMWGVFHETGVFASACPHGFILWLADMVQSGEQCVFPLHRVHIRVSEGRKPFLKH